MLRNYKAKLRNGEGAAIQPGKIEHGATHKVRPRDRVSQSGNLKVFSILPKP